MVRDWRIDEAEGRYRIFGNPRVRSFLDFGLDSISEANEELENIVNAQQQAHPRREYFLAVELLASGQTIGNVGFEYRPGAAGYGGDQAEIGYFFEPEYWGYGYATEASKLAIEFAFTLGASEVIAECDVKNNASEKVMNRCGLQRLYKVGNNRVRYGVARNAVY